MSGGSGSASGGASGVAADGDAGLEHLAAQRDELAQLVDQLGGSELGDHPSLRLLTDALEERLHKLDEKLEEMRRSQVRLTLHGDPDGVDARTAAALIGRLADAVLEATRALLPDLTDATVAEAARVHLTAVEVADDGACEVTLASPALPVSRQLVDPDSGRPVLHVALEHVCDELETAGSDLLVATAAAVLAAPLQLSVDVRTPAGERHVEVTRAQLQSAVG